MEKVTKESYLSHFSEWQFKEKTLVVGPLNQMVYLGYLVGHHNFPIQISPTGVNSNSGEMALSHLLFCDQAFTSYQQLYPPSMSLWGSRLIFCSIAAGWPLCNRIINLLRAWEYSASTFRLKHTQTPQKYLIQKILTFSPSLAKTWRDNVKHHLLDIPGIKPGCKLAPATGTDAWLPLSTGAVKLSGVCLAVRERKAKIT